MATENQSTNPYAAALADLRRKRAEIDNTIKVLEAMSGLNLADVSAASSDSGLPDATPVDVAADGEPFLGMSIVDAAKKLLVARNRKMGNKEIAKELAAGGLVMKSADPVNTVGSVMTRRFNQVGDVVRVGRGTWGLKEWYPNQSFKPSAKPSEPAETVASDRVSDFEDRHHEYEKFIGDLVGGRARD
ncbi:winged helix-turn-helix domain-containing protein [Qipengyuania zhejiangensis]|uniref:winged helix-turn-helix domain-containing protein n=1 Tax=Qipengyuania zhejiangensis TaxID=3077782 RepID=UPI002D76A88A|nr:winged helix-turn-helix domain-containing protein [Qipengyuania sp. Z2]